MPTSPSINQLNIQMVLRKLQHMHCFQSMLRPMLACKHIYQADTVMQFIECEYVRRHCVWLRVYRRLTKIFIVRNVCILTHCTLSSRRLPSTMAVEKPYREAIKFPPTQVLSTSVIRNTASRGSKSSISYRSFDKEPLHGQIPLAQGEIRHFHFHQPSTF